MYGLCKNKVIFYPLTFLNTTVLGAGEHRGKGPQTMPQAQMLSSQSEMYCWAGWHPAGDSTYFCI